MTSVVTKGTLRLGEVGPIIESTPGYVLTFGADGRTLEGQPPSGGGGGVVIAFVRQLTEQVFDNGTSDFFEALKVATAADFELSDPTGTLTLGDLGELTYTGPDVDVIVDASSTFDATELRAAYAWALNGDLIGADLVTAMPLGAAYFALQLSATYFAGGLTSRRRVSLTSGDVLQPVALFEQVILTNDLNMAASGVMIFFLPAE